MSGPGKAAAPRQPQRRRRNAGQPVRYSADSDPLVLLHELQVHQHEVQLQNEQLTAAQAELEEARDRYMDLYDFAPNGYLTLDAHGLILEINLTGAALLEKPRAAVVGMPLLGFIDRPHRVAFLRMLREGRARSAASGSLETVVRTPAGPLDVQLFWRPRPAAFSRGQFLVAMLDISERKLLEAQRETAAGEHASLIARLMSMQEDERRRIAREIHDQLGQQLTALRLKLERLGHEAGESRLREPIAEAQQLARQLDAQLDFFTRRLRPAALDDLGLETAVAQLVRDWSATFRVTAEFHSSGLSGTRIDADVETHLYRVVQEALNNVHKHAGASHVAVLLERRDTRLVLIVEDDGRGFVPLTNAPAAGKAGLGLPGMRERAALIGASFDVETAPRRGTTIFLQVPLARALQQQALRGEGSRLEAGGGPGGPRPTERTARPRSARAAQAGPPRRKRAARRGR